MRFSMASLARFFLEPFLGEPFLRLSVDPVDSVVGARRGGGVAVTWVVVVGLLVSLEAPCTCSSSLGSTCVLIWQRGLLAGIRWVVSCWRCPPRWGVVCVETHTSAVVLCVAEPVWVRVACQWPPGECRSACVAGSAPRKQTCACLALETPK